MTLKVALLFDCLSLELQEHKFTKFKYAAPCVEPQVENVQEIAPTLQPICETISSSSAVASSSTDVPITQQPQQLPLEPVEAEPAEASSDFYDTDDSPYFDYDTASFDEEETGFIKYELKRRKRADKKPKVNKKRYKKAYTLHKEELKQDMRDFQISLKKENAYNRIDEVLNERDEWNHKMSQLRPTTPKTSINLGKGRKAKNREEAKRKLAQKNIQKPQSQSNGSHNHTGHQHNAFVSNEEIQLQIAMQESAQATAPCGLSWEMIQLLQTRDITPEDYALLLQLDESVAPKTLESSIIDSFPVVTLTEESDEITGKEVCMVCLSDYEIGDEVRKLTKCAHVFHKNCIDNWLQNNSVKCPLDGLPLADDS